MKSKIFSFLAILAVLTIAQFSCVLAGDLNVDVTGIKAKGIEVATGSSVNIAGYSGEVVPVTVYFTSNVDVSDAKVKVWVEGTRDDVEATSKRIHLVEDSSYAEALSITLPTNTDVTESYTLYVRISTSEDYTEEEFSLIVQRDSYDIGVLSMESDRTVKAGTNLAIDVVLKNTGYENLDDVFVVVSIDELGISKKAYFEDITAEDNTDEDDDLKDGKDSAERTVYLKVPKSTESGVYEVTVKAYNADSSNVVSRNIVVEGAESDANVIAPIKSKEIESGEVTSYDLVIVNSGDSIGVYDIVVSTSEGLIISPQNSVVVVPSDSSIVTKINVKGLKEGTYSFTVNVKSGENTVEQITLNASVTESVFEGNVAVLTVVLAIVFVVLLVVLIVLLTRKPEKEEFEESYY